MRKHRLLFPQEGCGESCGMADMRVKTQGKRPIKVEYHNISEKVNHQSISNQQNQKNRLENASCRLHPLCDPLCRVCHSKHHSAKVMHNSNGSHGSSTMTTLSFLPVKLQLLSTTQSKSLSPDSSLISLPQFDDIPLLNPTGPTQPVGVYRSLNWPGLTIGTYLSTSPTGVVPQSGTHTAVFNAETKLLSLSPVAGITVLNDGSTTKSFSIPQFYYGCADASQESLVNVPAACKFSTIVYIPPHAFSATGVDFESVWKGIWVILLTTVFTLGTIIAQGYNSAGKLVAQQSFAYQFTSTKQGMMLAQPSWTFSNLYNVTFSFSSSVTSNALVGILDSVSLTTCTS